MKDERFERLCKHRSMYTLRRFSKLFQRWTLYEDRISDLSKTFDRWKLRTQESPRELVCQSEAKHKQAPQSEASVCRQWKCNLKKKTSLVNCTGHPTQIRGCVRGTRTQLQTEGDTCQYWNANHTISQGFEPDITFSTKKALQFTLSVFFKDEFIFN